MMFGKLFTVPKMENYMISVLGSEKVGKCSFDKFIIRKQSHLIISIMVRCSTYIHVKLLAHHCIASYCSIMDLLSKIKWVFKLIAE